MSQNFQPGDFLLFQIESGYGLLRVLDIEATENGARVWHLSAFNELFLDPETADLAVENPSSLTLSNPHFVITQRAFESTQVARFGNLPLSEEEKTRVARWKAAPEREISDRSARLMLGLR